MKFEKIGEDYFCDGKPMKKSTWYRDRRNYMKKLENSKKKENTRKQSTPRTSKAKLEQEKELIKYKYDLKHNFKYYNLVDNAKKYKSLYNNKSIKITKRLIRELQSDEQTIKTALKFYDINLKEENKK